jgi:hypothetical protein
MVMRRGFLFGLGVALAAPAIVRAQTILVPLAYKPLNYDSASINVAIQQAAMGGGGIVRLPAGVFNMSSGIIGADNVSVIGSGGRATELRWANALDGIDVFNGYGCNEFRVHDCYMNLGNYIGPTDGGSIARFGYDPARQKGGRGCEFRRNIITGLRRYGVFVDGDTRHLIADDNYAEASAPMNGSDTGGISNAAIVVRPHVPDASAPNGVRELLHVTSKINHNTTVNLCGLLVSLFKGEALGNNCRGGGYGGQIVVEAGPNSAQSRYIGNEGSQGVAVISGGGAVGFEIWGDGHEVAANFGERNAGDGMAICGSNIRAHANTMVDNQGAGIVGHPLMAPNTCSFWSNSTSGNAGGATRFPVPVIAGSNDFR